MKYIHVDNAADLIQYIPTERDSVKGTTRELRYLCTEKSFYAKYNQCQKAELIAYFWFKYWQPYNLDWQAEYKKLVEYNRLKRRIKVIKKPSLTVSIPYDEPNSEWLIHIEKEVYDKLPEAQAEKRLHLKLLKERLNFLSVPELAKVLGLTEEELMQDFNYLRKTLILEPHISDYQICQFMNYVISSGYREKIKKNRKFANKPYTYETWIKGQQALAKKQQALREAKIVE